MPKRETTATFLALILLSVLLLSCSGCAEGDGGDAANAAKGETASEGEVAAEGAEPAEEEEEEEEEAKKEDKPRKERTISVSVTPAASGDLVIPVVAEGRIRARNQTEIKFEIGGRVERVWIKEGQRVRRGQKLVSLDDREYRLQLEEANSRYLQALGQLAVEEEGYNSDNAERTLNENASELQKLERDGVITRRERLDRELALGMDAVRDGAYRSELLEVRSGLATARADAARLELDLEKTIVVAPFSGVITGMRLSRGERVQVGQTLGRLLDNVNVEAVVGVLESDLAALEVGRPARLSLPALGQVLEARIDVISPEIDEASRTCDVLLRLRSDDGKIKPGMFVRAAIAGQVYPDRLLVPRESILTRDGRPVLFRIEDNRAKWVYVQLGERNDAVVEIARVDQGGPLEAGTPVVVTNHLTLTHEAKVKVRKTIPMNDPWATEAESD